VSPKKIVYNKPHKKCKDKKKEVNQETGAKRYFKLEINNNPEEKK
jgi:hypothetical protein